MQHTRPQGGFYVRQITQRPVAQPIFLATNPELYKEMVATNVENQLVKGMHMLAMEHRGRQGRFEVAGNPMPRNSKVGEQIAVSPARSSAQTMSADYPVRSQDEAVLKRPLLIVAAVDSTILHFEPQSQKCPSSNGRSNRATRFFGQSPGSIPDERQAKRLGILLRGHFPSRSTIGKKPTGERESTQSAIA